MLATRSLTAFSRKATMNVLIAVLLVHTIILSYSQVIGPFLNARSAINVFLSPTEFHQKTATMFEQVVSDKERYWQAHSDLEHLDAEVPIDKILVEADIEGPNNIFYDPRLTISVYLDELARIGDTWKLPTLPFHWVDWTDVTRLNSGSGLDLSKSSTCQELQKHIQGHPDLMRYCRDRSSLSKAEVESLGYRNRNQLPKSVIFDHVAHENHAFNDIRVFMAKSYAMTHLPKPFKVIILNHGEESGTYEFMVNQTTGSDQRLLHSGMTERFVSSTSGEDAMDVLENGGTFRFNSADVYQKFVSSVKPRHLDENADIMNMYSTTKSPAGSKKDLSLHKENFEYPKEAIKQQIEEYEGITNRNALQQSYLDGLKNCAKYSAQNEPVYFKMASLDPEEPGNTNKDSGLSYDWRFFSDALFHTKSGWTKEERTERTNIILERLLRNWNRFAEEKGIVSWIMHGSLLSWYWNGLMFPYDVNIDIQMPISELTRLSKHYNQTLVVENPLEGYGRYLIDVGTYIHNRDKSETGNHVDARFVDVDSGVYIRISGIAKSLLNLPEEYKKDAIVVKNNGNQHPEVYNDRDKHFYTLDQLQPLHYSMLGGVPVYVPNEIEKPLKSEYSHGLDDHEFKEWYFVPKLQLWVPKKKLSKLFSKNAYEYLKIHHDIPEMVARVKAMSDDEGFRLLEDDEILSEYYFTSKFTDWHVLEKSLLFTEEGKDNLTALGDPNTRQIYDHLVGKVKFSKPLRKDLFEYEKYARSRH